MDSIDFSAIVFHPNTQQELTEQRNILIKEKTDLYPIFPLYGIFSARPFSKEQKKIFKSFSHASLNGTFSENGIFYLKGDFYFSENEKNVPFFIPAAISKASPEKSLTSIFSEALFQTKKSQNHKCDSGFPEIRFRTFQIADCRIDGSQYRTFENFWIKSTT